MALYGRCEHRGVLKIVRRIFGGSLAKRTAGPADSGLQKPIFSIGDEPLDAEILDQRQVWRNICEIVASFMVQLDMFQQLPPARSSVGVVEFIRAEAALGMYRWSLLPKMCEAVGIPLSEGRECKEALEKVEGTL